MDNEDDIMDTVYHFLDKFEPFYVLVIVIIGLCGNTISFWLFISTKLKYALH